MKKKTPPIIKEVLPGWVALSFYALLALEALLWWSAKGYINQLMVPIEKPYPVYTTITDIGKLNDCKEAWREDEALIKKLRRRLEP